MTVETPKQRCWWRQICIAQHSIKCGPIVLQSGPPLITLHCPADFDGKRKPESPSLSEHIQKKREISFIYWTPWLTAQLSFDATHTHTHKTWHLFSSSLLAVHCPCHMANEENQKGCVRVCLCVCKCMCVGGRGWQRGVIGAWPADKDSPLHQRSLWIHGDKPGWIGEQKPRRSRLWRDKEEEGAGVWRIGGISKMDVVGGIRRDGENERDRG